MTISILDKAMAWARKLAAKEEEKTKLLVNVSSPVLEFVEAVKASPSLYGIRRSENHYTFTDKKTNQHYYGYEIVDKKHNIVYIVGDALGGVLNTGASKYVLVNEFWPTKEEYIYLLEQLLPVFEAKIEHIVQLKQVRKQRQYNKRRQQLINIYCKE